MSVKIKNHDCHHYEDGMFREIPHDTIMSEESEEQGLRNGKFGCRYKRKVGKKVVFEEMVDKDSILWTKRTLENTRKTICHHRIVNVYGWCTYEDEKFSIIYEYMKYQSCETFFSEPHALKESKYWPIKHRILIEVAEALEYLITLNIEKMVQLNPLCENVMLDDHLNAKICNLQISIDRNSVSDEGEIIEEEEEDAVRNESPSVSERQSQNVQIVTKSYGKFVWEVASNFQSSLKDGKVTQLQVVNLDMKHNISPSIKHILDEFSENCESLLLSAVIRRLKSLNESPQLTDDLVLEITKTELAVDDAISNEEKKENNDIEYFWRSQPQIEEATPNDDRVHGNVKPIIQVSDLTTKDKTSATEDVVDENTPLIKGNQALSSRCHLKRYLMSGIVVIIISFIVFMSVYLTQDGPCPAMDSPSNGRFRCSTNSTSDDMYKGGTVCSLSCNAGYGVKSSTPNSSCHRRTWTSIPTCAKLAVCSMLPPPANNGSILCTDGSYEMSMCTYSCPSGYHLSSSYTSSVCLSTTKWNTSEPYCMRATPCPTLQNLTHGKYVCYPGNKPATNGTICDVECDENYDATKITNGTCVDDVWSNGINAIECQEACPKLQLSEHLKRIHCTNRRFNKSQCQLACDANYVLVGDNSLVCSTTRMGLQWNKKLPTCECPLCRRGEHCEFSISWTHAIENLNNSRFQYGNHNLTCQNVPKPPPGYKKAAICMDIDSHSQQQCNSNSTDYLTVAKLTLSTLILKNVYHHRLYELPCDAELMPKPCHTF